MLRFVTGMTGGGKTKYEMWELIQELVSTDRPIIGNVAWRLDPWVDGRGRARLGLLATLRKLYGEEFHARERMFTLAEDQVARFYAFRIPRKAEWEDKPQLVEVPKAADGRWHFDGNEYRGARYAIDEGHEYFRQADWQLIAKEAMSWASQNRRSGDDADILTQQAELVAKPFRRQSIQCVWMTNHAYVPMGPFRQPGRITWRVHLNTPPGDGEPALSSGRLSLEKDLLDGVYDTTAGAGVRGGAADMGKKGRGLHWAWIPVGATLAFLLVILGFNGCVRGGAALAGRALKPGGGGSGLAASAVGLRSAQAMAAAAGPVVTNYVPRVAVVKDPDERVTGVFGKTVFFSDGTSRSDCQWKNLGGQIVVDGRLYRWAKGGY